MAAAEAEFCRPNWRAELALKFAFAAGRTRLAERRHIGPLCVQKPFYPGDGACHMYLLHPPGGLAGGDELEVEIDVASNAAALITTPAATKFYRSMGAASVQTQTLRVAADGACEWLPLDTILFGGSRAEIDTTVHLHGDARFAGWEMNSLGRPLSGDAYASGSLRQCTQIFIDGQPQLLERCRWRAGDEILTAPWGLGKSTVWGSLYAYPASLDSLETTRAILADSEHVAAGAQAAATLLGPLLVVRYLGWRPESLRLLFESIWMAVRPAILNRSVSRPRIWQT